MMPHAKRHSGGLAEIAGLLLEETVRVQQGAVLKAFLTLVERAKFREFVKPGDSLTYRVKLESINELGGRTSGTIWRESRQIGEAQFIFGFQQVDNPVLEARRKEILDFWLRRADG
jgi:3-hydroxymyristoyl/3-hydroxydecanoyl-(acyl carrier protein) dehydratase